MVSFARPLWRLRTTHGPHPLAWDELREYGPLLTMRWDPHPDPVQVHPGVGVSYAAPDIVTVVAEVFQKTRRVVASTSALELVGWQPVRPLQLLDLTGTWLLRNRAAHSLTGGPRATCRGWARAIYATWPDLDGLVVTSTWTGKPMLVLFTQAQSSFPTLPAFSRLASDPLGSSLLTLAARELSWPVSL